MEIKINKEIRDYQESIFLGLSLRQFLFSLAAVITAVCLYFALKPYLGQETVSWVCVLGAAPFAVMGFVKYHGMTAEEFLEAYLQQQSMPAYLVSQPKNYYVRAMKDSSLKEVLKVD